MSPNAQVPLSVLDLVPVVSGSSIGEAFRTTVELARRAEAAGYRRYWLAEHHLNPGVAGASPALATAVVAAATSRIRVGAGAVQLGHRTALSVVEEFGILDALHPGRVDLGLGRSGFRLSELKNRPSGQREARSEPAASWRTPEGLLIPRPYSFAQLADSPLFALHTALVQFPGSEPVEYTAHVADVLGLLRGGHRTAEGLPARATPGEGADVEVWIVGSGPGESARVAGENGLPFAANYHITPGTVLDAVAAYRKAFRPSPALAEPYVLVSADAVVAPDDATARTLAAPYASWVRSIRSGRGAIPFPTPEEAARETWTDEDRALVADRTETQFVGSPRTVAAQLRALRDATGADELLVTTITHDRADRIRSYELLAEEWYGTSSSAATHAAAEATAAPGSTRQ
ncbi:LLM class flavin-dependent oxidoreductase [Streptomyces sp. NPDC001663]|uniref:LLM class flavin-dependent oxidoreductase n=1 Tax=Streptomyces sp. NPDC001663 TaxID=3364597 RepID=UPI0036BF153B